MSKKTVSPIRPIRDFLLDLSHFFLIKNLQHTSRATERMKDHHRHKHRLQTTSGAESF